MKQQVLVLHGGDTFATKEVYLNFLQNISINFKKMTRFGWKENLRTDLGGSFEVILPAMPNKTDARYEEWVIMFEKLIPFLRDGVILVGHSLGGSFLAKYLAENDFPHRIEATYLVAAPFGDNRPEYELLSFSLPASLNRFRDQAGRLTLYQGEDDPLVPITDAKKYKDALPGADLQLLSNRGHFSQEHFPELVDAIKQASR